MQEILQFNKNYLPEDLAFFKRILDSEILGSDCSITNLILLKKKYDIEICIKDGVLYRYYNGKTVNRQGYGFPVFIDKNHVTVKEAVENILLDARERNRKVKFCLCTQEQKEIFEKNISEDFRIIWNSDCGDSDYIYLQNDLALLPGRTFHKKKNHVSKFNKVYESDWNFIFLTSENFNEIYSTDIKKVLDLWEKNHIGRENDDLEKEKESIYFSLENFFNLKLYGGLLYVNEKPVAFCIASDITDETTDIHYEKAVQDFAKDGAYAVINQMFSKCVKNKYINREEDMNVEGLRKAKLSYNPKIILQKFYGEMIEC